METKDTILIRLPPEIKKQFQVICIQNNTNMSDVIREYIEKYIQNNKKI